MKKIFFWVLFLVVALHASAQKYIVEKGVITFFSHAAVEDITAVNEKAIGMFSTQTLDLAFSVPIREFQFHKKLMQEHFNGDKYMESDKYPKATFAGKLEGFDKNTQGPQPAKAKGKLTIHGVTLDVTIQGTAEAAGEKIMMKSKFLVKLAD
jgi:hypothetical protein